MSIFGNRVSTGRESRQIKHERNSVIQKKSQNASLLQHFRSHYVTVGSQKTPGCLPPIKPLCCQASEDVACKVAHLCRPEGKLQVAKAIHLAASVPRRWGDGGREVSNVAVAAVAIKKSRLGQEFQRNCGSVWEKDCEFTKIWWCDESGTLVETHSCAHCIHLEAVSEEGKPLKAFLAEAP